MDYQIIYNPDKNSKFPIRKKHTKSTRLLLILVLIATICITASNATVKRTLRSVFLPGDPDATEAAIVNLVENIKEGETVKDAVTAFCIEILEESTK